MTREPRADKPSALAGALRRLRMWLATCVAVVIIATAVLVGVGRLLIPHADTLKPWLESNLSERLGRPVSIGQVEASWPRLTPRITLKGIEAGETQATAVHIDRARLELHLPALMIPDRNPLRLVVLGLDLALVEGQDGRWGLQLAQEGGGSGSGSRVVRPASDLVLRDARVRVRSQNHPEIVLLLPEGEIRRDGERTGFLAELRLAGDPDAMLAVAMEAEHAGEDIRRVRGRADLSGLTLARLAMFANLPDFVALPPDRLGAAARFGWAPVGGSWLDLEIGLDGPDDFSASGQLRVERAERRIDARLVELELNDERIAGDLLLANRSDFWAAELPALELAGLHRLASRWLSGWDHWPERVAGELRDFAMLYRHAGSFRRLEGAIEGLVFDMPDGRASVIGPDLALGVSGDRAVAELSGEATIEWPAKMRQPIPVDSIGGRVIVSPGAIELDAVTASRPEARGRASGWVWLGGGRPFLDFIVEGEIVESVDPRPWLPAGQIPPRSLEWLDRALLRVGAAEGVLNYHFRLGHRFRDWRSGDFQAAIGFREAVMDYWPGWPVGRAMAGRVEFIGRSMSGQIDSARLGEVEVGAERVHIPDMREPRLSLDLAAKDARLDALRDVVADFPLEAWSRYLEPLEGEGAASLEVGLLFPFRDMASWQIAGQVDLQEAEIRVPAAGIRLPGLDGGIGFDRGGIEPTEVEFGAGGAGKLRLSAGFGAPAWIELAGRSGAATLVDEGSSWQALADRMSGAAEWRARLSGRGGGGWKLDFASDLAGLDPGLPEPLAKAGAASLPLDVMLSSAGEALQVSARLGERIALEAGRGPDGWRLSAGIGRGAPELPAPGRFLIDGTLERLDLDAWLRWIGELPVSAGGAGLRGQARLDVGRLEYAGIGLERIEFGLSREDSAWRVKLAGESVGGELVVPVPLDSGRVLAIDLGHLHLDRVIHEPESADLATAPIPGQTRTRVPTDLPPLHLLVESLSYRELPLGRMRLESHPRGDGVEIERIELAGPHLEGSGRGRWVAAEGGSSTQFEGRLVSTDLGPLLALFGHESGFNAERSQVDLSGSWPGSPADFALARLDGTLSLLMRDGSIPEARPGAGRLIGLVSLSTIPRRLMLDFRDVFAEGLKFDRIEGRFELAEGLARTEGVEIESPAAEITITGTTDMGAQTYDQVIVVEPGVSGTLPVIGGLAGGPVGAAAGLVLRSLLERPLQGIAEARYRVTGPWSEPQVELVEARAAEVPPSSEDEGADSEAPD